MALGDRFAGVPSGPSIAPRTFESASRSFILSEFRYESGSTQADSTGVATLQIGPVAQSDLWFLERIAVSTTSSATTRANVYVGSIDPQNIVDSTWAGNGDISDNASPILVRGSDIVIIQWTGATPGAECAARMQLKVGTLGIISG